jgi:nucleotide-binding universal stress UspA family protein
MLRDIVVHIPVEQSAQPVIDCAVSIGSIFDAHIDGIACVYPTFDPLMAFEASAANVAALTAATQSNMDKAASALDQFEIAARRIGISHGARCISNITYGATPLLLTEISRLYDLSIVAQSDYSKSNRDALVLEALLFDSGRPILMVPYIHRGPLKLDRILICWDGGRPAARAVHDAMPFLHRAKVIDIVSVNEDSATVGEASSEALQTHLARHDLFVEVQRTTADTENIFNAILSLAADKNTDLIVMGGYGHSKFREFVLGGVTRGIFETLTVPALISH